MSFPKEKSVKAKTKPTTMKTKIVQRALLTPTLLIAVVLLSTQLNTQAQHNIRGVRTYSGNLSDGATYLIEVPQNWNGTLLLYTQGYSFTPVPAVDTADAGTIPGDPLLRFYLLTHGYALAGSSASPGFRVHEALSEQIEVLDTFDTLIGQPSRTIAWGHSLGGQVSAGLLQRYPERFSGALLMCGAMAGSVGIMNQFLDAAFAFKTLLAPGSGLQIVNISDPDANLSVAEEVLTAAQANPQGRARIALVAALMDLPGWIEPFSGLAYVPTPEPSPTDYATQEANQFLEFQQGIDFFAFFHIRAQLEARAGGNPSWNTDVDYRRQLALSIDYAEVRELYTQAGLDLDTDLEALNNASRIAADPVALDYLSQNIIFNGQIQVPVLTLHTTDDELVSVENEQAYADVVAKASNSALLRQLFVHRAGHGNFTEAETIAALQALNRRLDTGTWQNLDPEDLNTAAIRLGAMYNVLFYCYLCSDFAPPSGVPMAPAFVDYVPTPFLRPYDAFTNP
jgi:pimeloyl-ACP methyl ester carboxylesterase